MLEASMVTTEKELLQIHELNQKNLKQNNKQKNTNQQSKFIGKNSKSAGSGLNKKGLTGGSRGS